MVVLGPIMPLAAALAFSFWHPVDRLLPVLLTVGFVLAWSAWAIAGRTAPVPLAAWCLAALAGIGGVQWGMGATAETAATEVRLLQLGAAAAFCWGYSAAAARLSRGQRDRTLDAVLWLGTAVALVCLANSLGRQPGDFLAFPNRNHFAAFCELLLPLAVWRTVKRRQALYGCAAALLVAGALLSGSRAALGIVPAELLALAFLLGGKKRVRWQWGAAAVLPVLAWWTVSGTPRAALEPGQLLLYRAEIWRSALDLISQKPLTGHGLGTFAVQYPSVARFDTGETLTHAHNDWLEWTVESGMLGLAFWLTLLLFCLKKCRRTPYFAGPLAIFAHSAVDYPLDKFALLLLLGWLVAHPAKD